MAIPWIHLPGQIYGWEAVNYNGVSLQHRREIGPVLGTINVFTGAESVRDSGIQRIYSGKDSRTDVKWSGIVPRSTGATSASCSPSATGSENGHRSSRGHVTTSD